MALVYIPPVTDTSKLATKEELSNSVQESNNYVDSEIEKITSSGGTDHVHNNIPVLAKLEEKDGVLSYNGVKINEVIYETVEG